MNDLLTYLFVGLLVLTAIGFFLTYGGAFIVWGIHTKLKWWQWLLAGGIIAFLLFLPGPEDCGSWWSC